jgi:Ca-activated chloride channel homolog
MASGFAQYLQDALKFFAEIRWDRPVCFWLSLLPFAIFLLSWFAAKRRKQIINGEQKVTDQPLVRKASREFVFSIAWICIVVGLAGPRWGNSEIEGVAVGRDLVLVVDLSRSMLCDDMTTGQTRWEAARDSALSLIDQLQLRGGHRTALVIFAARSKILVPLTTDFDYVRSKLKEINGRFPPPEIRPDRDDLPSGTRIGQSISQGILLLDQRYGRTQDVILFSDGDDPAEDREWKSGVTFARQNDVSIHCVGFGDPLRTSLINIDSKPLEFVKEGDAPDIVRTKLHEEVLSTIANETRGIYISSQDGKVDWRIFLRKILDTTLTRELDETRFPQKKSRSHWFFAVAALLFGVYFASRKAV